MDLKFCLNCVGLYKLAYFCIWVCIFWMGFEWRLGQTLLKSEKNVCGALENDCCVRIFIASCDYFFCSSFVVNGVFIIVEE